MRSRATGQEAAQESTMIEAGATHSDRDLWRFATSCAGRRPTRDREPVIQREWLIRLGNIDTSVRSCRKDLRR
jgi:hypothetical protein